MSFFLCNLCDKLVYRNMSVKIKGKFLCHGRNLCENVLYAFKLQYNIGRNKTLFFPILKSISLSTICFLKSLQQLVFYDLEFITENISSLFFTNSLTPQNTHICIYVMGITFDPHKSGSPFNSSCPDHPV